MGDAVVFAPACLPECECERNDRSHPLLLRLVVVHFVHGVKPNDQVCRCFFRRKDAVPSMAQATKLTQKIFEATPPRSRGSTIVGLRHKIALIRRELDVPDSLSMASAISHANSLMGTPRVGTLPQQADALLLALGFGTEVMSRTHAAAAMTATTTPGEDHISPGCATPPPSPPERSTVEELEHRAATRLQAAYRMSSARRRRHSQREMAVGKISGLRRQQTQALMALKAKEQAQKAEEARLEAEQDALAVHASGESTDGGGGGDVGRGNGRFSRTPRPMDMRHRISRLLDQPRSSLGASLCMVVLIAAIIASLVTFFVLTTPGAPRLLKLLPPLWLRCEILLLSLTHQHFATLGLSLQSMSRPPQRRVAFALSR